MERRAAGAGEGAAHGLADRRGRALCEIAKVLEPRARMESVIRRVHTIRAEDILPAMSAPGQRVFFLSPGHLAPRVGVLSPDFYARLLLLPRPGGLARMAAAVQDWCDEAALQVGFPVTRLDVAALVDPPDTLAWSGVPAARRAKLLTLAIDFVAQHALELAVFDLGDLEAQVVLGAMRTELARGGSGMNAVAIDHIFFGVMARKAERATGQVIAIAPGQAEDVWQFRQAFSDVGTGSIWRRGVVLAPPGALPGLALAAVAEHVVLQLLARRHASLADLDAGSGRLFAPPIEAALRAGVPVLAPRLSNLMPDRRGPELH